jgi:transcriptional regulator with XRE-family HTH domain
VAISDQSLKHFIAWLKTEMETRRWQPKDLSDATGMTLAQVTYVLSGERSPGNRFLRGVALAFEMPQETVFRIAGVLTDEEIADVQQEEITRKVKRLFDALDDEERARALHLLETYVRDHRKPRTKPQPARHEA